MAVRYRAGRYDQGMPTSIRDIIATSHYRQRFDRDRRRKPMEKRSGIPDGKTTFAFNDDGTFGIAATPEESENQPPLDNRPGIGQDSPHELGGQK